MVAQKNQRKILKREDYPSYSPKSNKQYYRKVITKDYSINNQGAHTLILKRCKDVNEANFRYNNYMYLYLNRRVNGVSKSRLNGLLGIGCPSGRKCGTCHFNGRKSKNKTKGLMKNTKREKQLILNDEFIEVDIDSDIDE
ncbi:MAG: hypothetical protein Edafosvirus5_22 [Edafosvirus sp.]|uniref:Uncharacterized protein n=1 Tax=Edafosvirus sp. TaxID=2487765 RepID=A0A3G4ZUW0_9VIRU|nr:MAG: hypothetical protein Edafosvirus5_22 [Edafosvirus sp.]